MFKLGFVDPQQTPLTQWEKTARQLDTLRWKVSLGKSSVDIGIPEAILPATRHRQGPEKTGERVFRAGALRPAFTIDDGGHQCFDLNAK